ncbi:MAG: PIN domain-containing protein [Streptosporangiales bacterium]|nr:PIN domain-containing protein [Streptosporangiales bacterium]
MIVVDTSAVVEALAARRPDPALLDRIAGTTIHAPHLIDGEFLHAIRGLTLGGKLGRAEADAALDDFMSLRIERHPVTDLLPRAWALFANVTAYDTCFVALAEGLDCPLVTCDAKLTAGGSYASVELYAR